MYTLEDFADNLLVNWASPYITEEHSRFLPKDAQELYDMIMWFGSDPDVVLKNVGKLRIKLEDTKIHWSRLGEEESVERLLDVIHFFDAITEVFTTKKDPKFGEYL